MRGTFTVVAGPVPNTIRISYELAGPWGDAASGRERLGPSGVRVESGLVERGIAWGRRRDAWLGI